MRFKKNSGFTIIELIIVIVIIGILAVISIPKYQDFQTSAKTAATKGTLAAVRSAYATQYAKNAESLMADPHPTSLGADNFANGQLPMNSLTGKPGVKFVGAKPTGEAPTDEAFGFWAVNDGADKGTIGAYSNGTEPTSGW